jgi:mono/diheme cytochrome c family protein
MKSRNKLTTQTRSSFGRWSVLDLARRALALLALGAGCHRDMHDQPTYETYEASDFFADGTSARPPVAGTVARGHLDEDDAFFRGRNGDDFIAQVPVRVDAAVLQLGQRRFDSICAVCHARVGDGNGMIVQRGFQRPPTYHSQRLRSLPDGYLFDVITNGYGAMPSYRQQLGPHERWAVVAYLRVLQFSQHVPVDQLTAEDVVQLERLP